MPIDNRATRRAQRSARGDHATDVPAGYDADAKAKAREETPVVIAGVSFRRRRKSWAVSRRLRELGREQERWVATGARLRSRIAELEAEQMEAAAKGELAEEEALEGQIEALVSKADEGTEVAETATYRILALLLVPPALAPVPDLEPGQGLERNPDELERAVAEAFGALDPDEGDDDAAVSWLQEELDTDDAVGIAQELTGSVEPDPQSDPSSGTGSS